MPDAFVIQIGGRTAGIVARDGRDRSFNFFAASQTFNAMEGQRFDDPAAAEKTARYVAKHGALPISAGDDAPVEARNNAQDNAKFLAPRSARDEPFGPAPWRGQVRAV